MSETSVPFVAEPSAALIESPPPTPPPRADAAAAPRAGARRVVRVRPAHAAAPARRRAHPHAEPPAADRVSPAAAVAAVTTCPAAEPLGSRLQFRASPNLNPEPCTHPRPPNPLPGAPMPFTGKATYTAGAALP